MLRNIARDGAGILDTNELKAEIGPPMSFFDDLQNSINRGVAGANRTGNTIKLKAQLSEAMKRRQTLAAQLGASLYDATKDDPTFRAGREAIYDGIAAIDAERAGYQAEIDRIEAEAQAAQAAAVRYTCPFCGSSVAASDLFCSGCGKPMAEIEAEITKRRTSGIATTAASSASSAATCPQCGFFINEGDTFCMNCGAKLESMPKPEPEPVAVPEPVDAPAPEPVISLPNNTCPTCGATNDPEDKFCMHCGTKLR